LQREIEVPVFDLVISITNTMDLISPLLVNHHKQVAYLAWAIAEEMGLSWEEQKNIMLAGALHDIGGISVKERVDALHFEIDNTHLHAETGYNLLRVYEPFSEIAQIIRYHHIWWNKREDNVSLESHILHLADRVVICLNKDIHVLSQIDGIVAKVEKESGRMFMPWLVEAFKNLAAKEYIWFDLTSNYLVQVLREKINLEHLKIGIEDLCILARIFSNIIDFRSPFTANHSGGVAATAESLAGLLGFSHREQRMMRIAGLLHDLGKLAIPPEILEKPGRLNKDEFNIIKAHTFYTYRILSNLKGFDTINKWSSFHHERLDGTGYPFHLKEEDLPVGSRVLAVADVFTAVTEDRPYRKGLVFGEVANILKKMAGQNILDKTIVNLLLDNYQDINTARIRAQKASSEEYRKISHKEI